MTSLKLDFPMAILASYNGISNLDVTLDDQLVPEIESALDARCSIVKAQRCAATPGSHEEFLRYEIEVALPDPVKCAEGVIDDLTSAGFARGCTIRNSTDEILRSDRYTADILERRRLALEEKRSKRSRIRGARKSRA